VHSAVSLTTRVSSITLQEIFDYGNYDDAEFTGAATGFGTTEDLDIELDEVRQRVERWFTPERIDCTMMTVEPGQMTAVRFATEGVHAGMPVITLEHVTRLTSAAAPDWEFPPQGHTGVHRVVVEVNRGWKSTRTSPIWFWIPLTQGASRQRVVQSMRSSGCVVRPRADPGGGHSVVRNDARPDVERALVGRRVTIG
jgi:hypothetical protein